MTMETGRRHALGVIASESERLFHLAKASGNSSIADLIRKVLDETDAALRDERSAAAFRFEPTSVVQFPTSKPHPKI